MKGWVHGEVHGGYMVGTWWVHGRVHGGYMVGTWWVHMVGTW